MMLAQNFLRDPKISDAEFEALIKLLGVMERGELVHVKVSDPDAWYKNPARRKPLFNGTFNMGQVFTLSDCGTAGCIAGACDMAFGTKFAPRGNLRFDDIPISLLNLFCPDDIEQDQWPAITVPQAAAALRNYLTIGNPRWSEALASCKGAD
jgi:hypothetical protein